jgi:8-oxo-dGTP diphosphatase
MRPIADDGFSPNDEVDEVRWAAPEDAASLISYDRDRIVLDAL